jgi:GTPase SAR1 family protein
MFRATIPQFYRHSVGAFVFYDITCRHTFEYLDKWLSEARDHAIDLAIFQIVACKRDMEDKREVTTEEGKAFADSHGIRFIETSAMSKYNVEETFKIMAEDIYDKIESGEFTIKNDWEGIKVCGHTNANISMNDSTRSNSGSCKC